MRNIIYATHREDARGNVFTVLFSRRVDWGGKSFLIPRGFESDGASVPRLFWRVVFPNSDSHATTAGICHDYIYRLQPEGWTREEADRMFLALLVEFGANRWAANRAYEAVRLFGWLAWSENEVLVPLLRMDEKKKAAKK